MENNTQSCGCATTNTSTHLCPTCNSVGTKISSITLKAQLKKEKYETLNSSKDDFNFCNTPKCNAVYYSNDGKEVFNQDEVRNKIAIKNDDLKTPLCYCKKLLKQNVLEMIQNKEENIPAKIKKIISSGKSFCEKSNPKGACCPDEITSFLADYGINYNHDKINTNNESSSCGTSSSTSSCGC